jgi:hypothetical protein
MKGLQECINWMMDNPLKNLEIAEGIAIAYFEKGMFYEGYRDEAEVSAIDDFSMFDDNYWIPQSEKDEHDAKTEADRLAAMSCEELLFECIEKNIDGYLSVESSISFIAEFSDDKVAVDTSGLSDEIFQFLNSNGVTLIKDDKLVVLEDKASKYDSLCDE